MPSATTSLPSLEQSSWSPNGISDHAQAISIGTPNDADDCIADDVACAVPEDDVALLKTSLK